MGLSSPVPENVQYPKYHIVPAQSGNYTAICTPSPRTVSRRIILTAQQFSPMICATSPSQPPQSVRPTRDNHPMKRLSVITLTLLACTGVQAGTLVEIESRGELATESGRYRGEMLIDTNRLRMNINPERSLIFVGATSSLILINHTESWYTVLDQQAAQSIASTIDPLAREIREQLSGLPEDQKEWITGMLGGVVDLSDKPASDSVRVVESGKTGTSSAGKQCRWLQVYRAEKLAQENCIGPATDMGGGEALSAVFKDASRFYQDVIGQLNSSGVLPIPENMFPEMVPPGGLPMISRRFEDGKLVSETRILDSRPRRTSEQDFLPPKGYTKRQPGIGLAIGR